MPIYVPTVLAIYMAGCLPAAFSVLLICSCSLLYLTDQLPAVAACFILRYNTRECSYMTSMLHTSAQLCDLQMAHLQPADCTVQLILLVCDEIVRLMLYNLNTG
jgi:hypothetical protein